MLYKGFETEDYTEREFDSLKGVGAFAVLKAKKLGAEFKDLNPDFRPAPVPRRVAESMTYNPSLKVKREREESVGLFDTVNYRRADSKNADREFPTDHKGNVLDGGEKI